MKPTTPALSKGSKMELKPTTGGTSKGSNPHSLIKGVPILHYCEGRPSPMFPMWNEKLQVEILTNYPGLETMITEHSYPDEVEIKLPTPEEEAADAAAGGYRRMKIQLLMKQQIIDQKKLDINKKRLFGFMMSTLSDDSIAALDTLAKYTDEIKLSGDPLKLYEAIELTHSTAFTTDTALMEVTVKNGWDMLRQRPDQTLIGLKREFAHYLTKFDALELPRPSDLDQARHFLNSVSIGRYGDITRTLLTRVQAGEREYPADLHAMYLYLVSNVPDSNTPYHGELNDNTNVESTFIAADSAASDSDGEDKQRKDKKSKGKHKPDKSKSKTPTKPCMVCPKTLPEEDRMHWTNECPRLEEFWQHLAQKEAKKKAREKKEEDVARWMALGDDDDDSVEAAF